MEEVVEPHVMVDFPPGGSGSLFAQYCSFVALKVFSRQVSQKNGVSILYNSPVPDYSTSKMTFVRSIFVVAFNGWM